MKEISLFGKTTGFAAALLSDCLHSAFDVFTKPKGFEAHFGRETDIASRFNKGFVISKHRKLTRKQSYENVLLAGPTGSGKTVRLLLKNLYELKNCSIVVNDPSKELHQLASGYLSQYFDIKTLNFSDSSVSSGYNILRRIKKPNDIQKVAHVLVSATLDKGSGDPFWSLQSKSILALFIRLVLYQPPQFQNMANVLHLLNLFAANPEAVDHLIVATEDEKLLLDYKALVATPEKTLQSIVVSAKSSLMLFDDPEIAKVTAYDSIDFDALRTTPTVLFLHNNIADQSYYSVLNSIFFEQLYGYALERTPTKTELDLFIIIEEASSLRIPILPTAIVNTRKHRVANLICVQSPGQLKTSYHDDAANIASSCLVKVYLPGQTDMDTLKSIETLSGQCIHIDEKKTERVKPLITADQIRMLPENRTLIVATNKPIIKGRTSPYYRSRKYRRYASIPPAPCICEIPDDKLSFIKPILP